MNAKQYRRERDRARELVQKLQRELGQMIDQHRDAMSPEHREHVVKLLGESWHVEKGA